MNNVELIVSFSLIVVSVLLIIVMTWSTLKTLDEYLELKLRNSEEKFKDSLRERQLDNARRALEWKEDFKQILKEELYAPLKEETEQIIKLQELQEKINKLQEKE